MRICAESLMMNSLQEKLLLIVDVPPERSYFSW